MVSGRVSGDTETLTLFVKASTTSSAPTRVGAYGASVVLLLLAVIVVVLMNLLNRKEGRPWHHRL